MNRNREVSERLVRHALFGILLFSFGTMCMQLVITFRVHLMENRIARLELQAKPQSMKPQNKER